MAVTTSDTITASYHNTLVSNLNKYWGDLYPGNTVSSSKTTNSYGWGNNSCPTVSISSLITDTTLNELINRNNLAVTQTGHSSNITAVNTGELVLASTVNAIESSTSTIQTYRFTNPDSTLTSGGGAGSSSHASWTSKITCNVTITFSSFAKSRYFFNSGGQIRLSFANSGNTNDALAWQDLFDSDDMDTLIFSYFDISQTGSRAGNITSGSGVYDLTTSSAGLYNISLDQSSYTNAILNVNGYRNSDGTSITLTISMDNKNDGTVNGNTLINVDTRKANDKSATDPAVSFSITAPTISVSAWTET